MSFVIEDGLGSTSKAGVLDNRLKEMAESCSLMNHISSETTEKFIPAESFFGEGVFTLRNSGNASFGIGTPVLSIQNNDPNNICIIDRIYVQAIFDFAQQLFTNFFQVIIGGDNASVNATKPMIGINENRTTNISPSINRSLIDTFPGSGIEIYRIFPTNGIVEEIIPQNSDGIILTGGPPVQSSDPASLNNRSLLHIELDNTNGLGNVFFNACMRFTVIDPEELV